MRRGAAALLALAAACAGGPPGPASLDTQNETCAGCRMAVSDPRLAAQIVARFEEPRFFDDLGCLRDYLAGGSPLPEGAVAYVADHRTGSWVRAERAVYARVDSLDTPMGSHLVAHAGLDSQQADLAARGGAPVRAGAVLGRLAARKDAR